MNPHKSPKKVLLIDDDPAYGSIVAAMAICKNIDLHFYESLIEATYGGSRVEQFDSAIIDYNLERMTGIEVSEYLELFFKDIPVILISTEDRSPQEDQLPWPPCLKKFMNKSEGYEKILNAAIELTA